MWWRENELFAADLRRSLCKTYHYTGERSTIFICHKNALRNVWDRRRVDGQPTTCAARAIHASFDKPGDTEACVPKADSIHWLRINFSMQVQKYVNGEMEKSDYRSILPQSKCFRSLLSNGRIASMRRMTTCGWLLRNGRIDEN